MRTIFVVSENQNYFNYFYRSFSNLPVHFTWVGGMETAFKYIALEKPALLFLVSKTLERLVEWIQIYREQKYDIPFACFTRSLDWTNREMLWKMGAVDVVRLPVERNEMEYILQALARGLQPETADKKNQIKGRLADFRLIDLIQTFENRKKNGVLILENGIRKGEVEFYNGKIVNASYNESDPLEAINIMAGWTSGFFFTQFDKVKRRERIVLNNQQVILECQNYLNAITGLLSKFPPVTDILFSEPDLDYDEIGPHDRTVLLKFKSGLSIQQFLDDYIGNVKFILQKFELWFNKNWLLSEAVYEEKIRRIKEHGTKSAFSKTLRRIFGKQTDTPFNLNNTGWRSPEITESSLFPGESKKKYRFSNFELIRRFLIAMEEC